MAVFCGSCGSLWEAPHADDITIANVQRLCPQCRAPLKRPISPREDSSPGKTILRVIVLLCMVPEAWLYVFAILASLWVFLR